MSAEFILGALFTLISGLAAVAYKTQAARVSETFAAMRSEMSKVEKVLKEDQLTAEEKFNREIRKVMEMHERDHQGTKEGIRMMMENHAGVMKELWAEIKSSRQERVITETKLWESMERITNNVNSLHLELAKSYPTKDEFVRLLDDKLRALKDSLRGSENGKAT